MNWVRTYNASGKCMYEARFATAEKAYKEYMEIIENSKNHLPKGYEVTVVRFVDNAVMTMETVVGRV